MRENREISVTCKKQFCKTPVEVTIYGEGVTEDGTPLTVFECKNLYPSENLYPSNLRCGGNAVCNVQSKAKTVYTKEQKIVQVSAVLLLTAILPPTAHFKRWLCNHDGVKRSIVQGTKHRNPDGTVNFTELDVI